MGHVYVLVNASMPGVSKVGRSTSLPERRADDLRSTGVPTPFTVAFSTEETDAPTLESRVHRVLDHCRVSPDREFFRIAPEEAAAEIARQQTMMRLGITLLAVRKPSQAVAAPQPAERPPAEPDFLVPSAWCDFPMPSWLYHVAEEGSDCPAWREPILQSMLLFLAHEALSTGSCEVVLSDAADGGQRHFMRWIRMMNYVRTDTFQPLRRIVAWSFDALSVLAEAGSLDVPGGFTGAIIQSPTEFRLRGAVSLTPAFLHHIADGPVPVRRGYATGGRGARNDIDLAMWLCKRLHSGEEDVTVPFTHLAVLSPRLEVARLLGGMSSKRVGYQLVQGNYRERDVHRIRSGLEKAFRSLHDCLPSGVDLSVDYPREAVRFRFRRAACDTSALAQDAETLLNCASGNRQP